MKYPKLRSICAETPNTVIDNNWGDIFKLENIENIPHELCELTGEKTYKKVLEKYEGYTVEELLKLFDR